MPNEFESYRIRRYLEPNTENILGFIAEETVKQITGFNRRAYMETELPSFRSRAKSVIDSQGPLAVSETVEKNEVKQVSFAPVLA